MKVNLKSCKDAILKEAEEFLSEEDAQSFVDAIEARIQNIDSESLVSIEDKMREIGAELLEDVSKMALIQKRNALFTVKAMRSLKKSANLYADPAEGILAYLEDSRKIVEGAGKGTNAVIEGWKARYLGELKARLMKEDLFEDFRKDRLEREIFLEFYSPGSSGSKKAAKIRDILFSLKQDAVEKQNLHGSFIHFLPEHVKRQTYNPTLIKKQFGPVRFKNRINFNKHLTPKEYEATFKEWASFIKPLLDSEETFKDSSPDKFLRGVFDGVMSGKHGPIQKASGAEVNSKFFRAGALAKKASSQRLLHFKDGEAAYRAHKAFSSEPLSAGIISEIEHSSHNIGLMQTLGPNPEATLDEVLNQLEFELSRAGEEKKLRSIQNRKGTIKTALKFLNNEAKVPENPTYHTAVGSVMSFISQAKLGKLLLFAMPDKTLLQSTLTRNGLSNLDAFAKALKLTKPKNPDERLRIIMLGGEVKSFINTVNSRFTTGAEGHIPSVLAKSQKHFFNFTGINYLDDLGTSAILGALPRHAGSMAQRSWEKLIPEMKNMLTSFGFRPSEWDAIRSTAYSVDERGNFIKYNDAEAWITPDQFEKIPEDRIDALLAEENIKPAENNRKRKIADLESKYRSWLISQRDEGVLMPGSKEHRLAAFGTQAGTAIGSLTRLLMMFKSFPITVYTKIIKREIQGRGASTVMDWLRAEKNSNFHTLQLVAMLTAAGYISLAVDDLISGRKPQTFYDDEGKLNPDQALKTLREAFIRGGAGGIFGDLLLREYDNSYNTVARALGGPVLSEFERGASIASDISQGEFDGAKTGAFIKGNTPWINLFYIKPALDYLVFYNLQEMLDPGSLEKMERDHKRKYNSEYWLSPSEALTGN